MSQPPGAPLGDGMHLAALRLADEMARRADDLGVAVRALPNGTRLIDAGVAAAFLR